MKKAAVRLLFSNEAHLRCMKNEVWLRHMKFDGITPKVCHALHFIRALASTSWQQSCRFMFAGQTLHSNQFTVNLQNPPHGKFPRGGHFLFSAFAVV
jgi:hypothetical protein